MKVECKLFDLKDLTEGQLSFIAESFFSEANDDFESGYMALATNNYETAYELFSMVGNNEWYKLRANRCQDRLEEIKETKNV
jgi:hypothetical protein